MPSHNPRKRAVQAIDSLNVSIRKRFRIHQNSLLFRILPKEILVRIVSLLDDPEDRICCEAASVQFREIVESAWKSMKHIQVLFSRKGMTVNKGNPTRLISAGVLKLCAVLNRCGQYIVSVHIHSSFFSVENFRASREILSLFAEYQCPLEKLCLVHVAAAQHLLPFAKTLKTLRVRWGLGQNYTGPDSESVQRLTSAISLLRNLEVLEYSFVGPEPHRMCLAFDMARWMFSGKQNLKELYLCRTYLLNAEELAAYLPMGVKLRVLSLRDCQNLSLADLIHQRPEMFEWGTDITLSGAHISPNRAFSVIEEALKVKCTGRPIRINLPNARYLMWDSILNRLLRTPIYDWQVNYDKRKIKLHVRRLDFDGEKIVVEFPKFSS